MERRGDLQAKDWVSTRMAHLGKRDKAAREELIALVHIDTTERGLDIGHGRDAVKGPDRGRFRHSPGHDGCKSKCRVNEGRRKEREGRWGEEESEKKSRTKKKKKGAVNQVRDGRCDENTKARKRGEGRNERKNAVQGGDDGEGKEGEE